MLPIRQQSVERSPAMLLDWYRLAFADNGAGQAGGSGLASPASPDRDRRALGGMNSSPMLSPLLCRQAQTATDGLCGRTKRKHL
jgi:hypothetical protein